MKRPLFLFAGCVALASVGLTSCTASKTKTTSPEPSSSDVQSRTAAIEGVKRLSTTLDPATGEGAVATGEYRNVFVELGHSEEEVRAKLDLGFQSLFHGSEDNQAVYYVTGENENGPLAQIRDIGNNDVRSEGMSYGMMIAVQMDHQEEFNALWNWALTYMRHSDPKHPAYRYFAWQTTFEGKAIDQMPAPDGEEYFAMALYFAAGRWGNGEGIYNYHAYADEILDAIKNRKDISGMGKSVASLFNREKHQIRFSPDKAHMASHGDHTDPSYHLPAFYELWAIWGPEADRPFWKECAKVSRDFFVAAAHPKTGLVPEYSTFDGEPLAASWNPNTVNFAFDAWRTAMNWSVDWLWFKADPRQQELSDRLLAFFRSQGRGYANQFTLEGEPKSTDYSSGLEAMNAVAAMASTQEYHEFIQALWLRPPPTGKWRYYDGLLYLMGMLHASGEFRAYTPKV